MPELGFELHDRWSEGVFVRDPNIDGERATLVRGPRRTTELPSEMSDVIGTDWIGDDG